MRALKADSKYLRMTGMNKETGLDLEQLRQKVPRAWDFIFDLDMAKHRDDAIHLMDLKLGKE